VIEWILNLPFWVAAGFLAAVAALRGQCTYWVGRAVNAGLARSRWSRRLRSERFQGGIEAIQKWGWPIIPLSFLTVGFQTAVNAGAGLLGWPWLRYTLAAIPGYLLWGAVYATGGLAAFGALFALARQSWWIVGLAGLALAALAGVLVARRRQRRLNRP